MNIRPCGFQVLIEMEDIEQTTESGLVIRTRNEQEREITGNDVGRVVSFGPIAFQGFAQCNGPEDWGVKVGDRVEFKRYDGKIPRYDEDKKYRIINDSDILMVIEDE